MKKIHDPFSWREAQKYTHPIPSRECIIQFLTQQSKPMLYEKLAEALGLRENESLEALRRRLIAMQRDGQLLQTRRGAYALVNRMKLISGHIEAHKEGYGFLIPDDSKKEDIYLAPKQMRLVFHHDRALVGLIGKDSRNRLEGRIVEVLERNTPQVVGQYGEEGGVGFLKPEHKKIFQNIVIPLDKNKGAKPGQMVNARILVPPTLYHQAIGEITEILGEPLAPGMEINVALRAYQLPHVWPDSVHAIEPLLGNTLVSEPEDRKDLRSLFFVTIDGEDAKDFDDAVYAQPENKNWRLWVAIADVGHYVSVDSVLDEEAAKRGTSVYFPTQVIPMLPEFLSNDLCSLKPEVDRFCLVAEILISPKGKIIDYVFYPALIRSKARMTYTQVSKLLQGDLKLKKQYKSCIPHLENLHRLYSILAGARQKRGALEFDSVETQFIFRRDKKIDRIIPRERTEAHRLIEEMMLVANVCASQFLLKAKIPILYRIHEKPNDTKWKDLKSVLSTFSLGAFWKKNPGPRDFALLLEKARARPDRYLIETLLLRSMSQAIYSPKNSGHFGLAYEGYTHFTSPIRRYPDLLVHRAIRHVLKKRPIKQWPYSIEKMKQLAEHCSQTERRADEATRDVADWLKCEYMVNKIGKKFTGRVSGVTHFGLFIALDEIYIEGLVHVTALPSDYYDYDPIHHRLCGERRKIKYQLGDRFNIIVSRVDLNARKIDFELT